MGESKNTDIRFFGEIDRVNNQVGGEIKHSYPAWYFTNKLDDLQTDISDLKGRIKNAEEMGAFMDPYLPEMKRELMEKETQYGRIAASKPKLSASEKDSLAKMYEELGNEIADNMPNRTDMERGTVSAHEEAKRMKDPCIKVPHGTAMLMQKMGINAERGGKVSRDAASKAYKIAGRLLEENTNVERLRRDVSGGSYKIHRSLQELEEG